MSTSLTPVPDCEESPIIIGESSSPAGAVCGNGTDDPNAALNALTEEVRCLKAEVTELKRVQRLLRRKALIVVTHPNYDMTGVTYDGNPVDLPQSL